MSPSTPGAIAPVLEVLLPLHRGDPGKILGFAQYFIDARPLTRELAAIDGRMRELTSATLGIGVMLIAAVVAVSYFRLRRAQRLIAERNQRLIRANFELTLAAKASALGQITSHLMHGLQGSVAGLDALVRGHEPGQATPDWATAAGYTERIQTIIHEAVSLLGDSDAENSFELTGAELAAIVRRRNTPAADQKGVELIVRDEFSGNLDGHRGGLLCLIVNNLVQNALAAATAGKNVTVFFSRDEDQLNVAVADEGPGIAAELLPHLFEPGRSGRTGGSGLGLAISRLLARQIGASLVLESTGPAGTLFRLLIPLASAATRQPP
jgi:signal transduction histidine kinase